MTQYIVFLGPASQTEEMHKKVPGIPIERRGYFNYPSNGGRPCYSPEEISQNLTSENDSTLEIPSPTVERITDLLNGADGYNPSEPISAFVLAATNTKNILPELFSLCEKPYNMKFVSILKTSTTHNPL